MSISPVQRDDAARLIRIIREQHGYDDADAHSTPSSAVIGLRGKLERALERLSSDLYNKKTHFLLEFIQNADDNTYADDVTPSLKLRIEDSLVVFECNELGFSADNVKAICDIGASTKTHENSTRGFIGEKGIGFKSVFTVANEVHISSGPYSFHFDRTAQLGMITPVLGSAYPPTPDWTTFHLRLAPSENGTDLSSQLSGLRPTLLLFLRQLRALTVTVPGAARRALKISREDGPGDDLVSLMRVANGKVNRERYVLVGHDAQTPDQEPGREGIKQSKIMLAFPVSETGEPVIGMQEVHAFLPLRCYGFNFIIQADFITSASREDVLAHKEWNRALLRGIIDAFLLAVERFVDHPTLRNVWFRYLPESISDSFFCYAEHKLMTELQRRPILRSSDGTYDRPSQFIILTPPFRDDVGAPLIPEEHLPRGLRYLSPDYNAHDRDGFILRHLGVREMTDDDFLEGLQTMDQADLFGSKSAAWHESIATCILRLLGPIFGRGVRPEVTLLRILPLRNGSWAPAASASKFMFPPAGVSIPDDLGLQSIAPDIPAFSSRYNLFSRLGVTLSNPATIAQKILFAGGPRQVEDRVAHARFFFEHRAIPSMPPAARLRLADERGLGAQADELYLDLPGKDGALALRDALSPLEARFLHPNYLSVYEDDDEVGTQWISWLQDTVGVNVVPRVLDGHLTSDFLDRAPELAGPELLLSLRAWYPRLVNHLTQAGARALGDVPIAGRRLDRLYLRRGALARADHNLELPFVPVEDPEDRRWDFLEKLGVAICLNAQFWLNKLVHMQGRGEKDGDMVAEIYRQLDARFDEDEELIREAFTTNPIILVQNYLNERIWLRKMDVYWDGPPSMTTRAVISYTYPHLSNFFFRKLGITSAPPYALIEELGAIIAKQHRRSGPVPPEVQEHIADILADITKIMQAKPAIPESFHGLAQMAIFPASVPGEGIALLTADEFYVPDKSGKYANVFRERVALLALPEAAVVRIRPLLESAIFKDRMRYLEAHVTKRSTPVGKRVLEAKATDLYSSRVEYIARLVYHANKASLPQHAKDLLPKLRKITVIGVESITTTLSLGTCHEPTPEDVSFEETDDKYTVFFSRSSTSTSIDLHICGQLSRLLEINMTALFFCVNSNSAVVNGLFDFQGIEQIPDDSDDGDGSWLQAMLHPNEPVVPPAPVPVPAFVPVPTTATEQRPLTPPLPTPSPSLSSVSVHDTRQFPPLGTRGPRTPRQRMQTSQTPFHSPLNGHAHGVNGRQRHRSEVGVAEHSQFLTPPLAHPGMTMGNTRDMGRLAAQAQAFLNGNVGQSLMVPGTTGNPVWPPFGNFGVPPPMTGTEDTDLVGVMGEHYVFKKLGRMLDDFGPNNWTSELRNYIPGFAHFRGNAYADFTYDDTRGQLTREWFGPEKAALWHDRWPRYHIEVKSTRGVDEEPFHMSRAQMVTASRFSERAEVGADIYVIMRVSRIGEPEPSYMVYADPHRALFYGHLQYAHDVYLQRNTELQV